MGRPRLLLLQQTEAGHAITRWTAEGEFAGDTWHPSSADAKDTAAWEYGEGAGSWTAVPQEYAESDDVMDFLLKTLD